MSSITARGHELVILPRPERYEISLKPGGSELPKHFHWLETSLEKEIEDVSQAIQKRSEAMDWMVLDHYALDSAWESSIRSLGLKLMVIDDLADRPHSCEILLDQSYFRDASSRYENWLPRQAVRLLGPKFALLRQAFLTLRKSAQPRSQIQRVLVSFGASDQTGGTAKALEALLSIRHATFSIRVVLGANDPQRDLLQDRYSNHSRVLMTGPVNDFCLLILESDLFIGAGGTTTWERLCLGLPGIVLAIAENQEPLSKELADTQLIRYLGRSADTSVAQIRNAVETFISSSSHSRDLAEISEASMKMVDGLGCQRASRWLELAPLSLRRAERKDAETLWKWANDPVVRASAFDPGPIPWEGHLHWFEKKLNSNQSQIWIATGANGVPLGQIRFDLQEDQTAVIDVSVAPTERSAGLGAVLIRQGTDELFRTGASEHAVALVKTSNLASRNAFLGAGFQETATSTQNGEAVWKLEKHKEAQRQ